MNSLDIASSQYSSTDFCAIEGTTSGVFAQAKELVIELFSNPDKLWAHIDHKFLASAVEDVKGLTKSTLKNHYFVKSITYKDAGS